MDDLKPLLIPTLLELMRVGASRGYVAISTSELAVRLDQSQQAASQHLLELEKDGMIERKRTGLRLSIQLTPKGVDAVRSFFLELKGILEEKRREYIFQGKLFQGLGEGGYYVSLPGYKTQFTQLLGWEPFPGTLNLRLESPLETEQYEQLRFGAGLKVKGFTNGERTYGGATCYKGTLNGKHPAAILVIDRTHYDNSVLEIISPLNVRDELGLSNGDAVTISVTVAS